MTYLIRVNRMILNIIIKINFNNYFNICIHTVYQYNKDNVLTCPNKLFKLRFISITWLAIFFIIINSSSSSLQESLKTRRGHHELMYRFTNRRHSSSISAFLGHWCKGISTAALIWSVHLIDVLPRGLMPSSFPCTTKRSID